MLALCSFCITQMVGAENGQESQECLITGVIEKQIGSSVPFKTAVKFLLGSRSQLIFSFLPYFAFGL